MEVVFLCESWSALNAYVVSLSLSLSLSVCLSVAYELEWHEENSKYI